MSEEVFTPRGLRNNNPLNIRLDGVHWDGEKEPSTDKSFKQFITMAYGYRAAFVLLGTYIGREWNTIEKIITHWAPPNENNTKGYIDSVSRISGVDKEYVLKKSGDSEKFIRIVSAMSRIENGVQAVDKDVEMGFMLQKKIR